MIAKNERHENTKQDVLVVGDWVIDENWLVASHDPMTSTHAGREHYRLLVDDTKAQILSLCGSGNVARALHGLHDRLSIYGLGLWHPQDTKIIASLFSLDEILINESPFTLERIIPDVSMKGANSQLISLCGKQLPERPCQEPDKTRKGCDYKGCKRLFTLSDGLGKIDIGTTRVIRVYKYGHFDNLECTYRFDWEKDNTGIFEYFDFEKYFQQVGIGKINFSAIVVDDLNKGVVTDGLIKYLVRQFPKANWYVRSKVINPSWVHHISPDKLCLRVIGAELMQKLSSTIKWHLGKIPSLDAINNFKELVSFNNNSKNVNYLLAGIIDVNHAFVVKRQHNDFKGYLLVKEGRTYPINVGRSNIFFASLVSSILESHKTKGTSDNNDEKILKFALSHSFNWTKACTESFEKGGKYHLRGNYETALLIDNNIRSHAESYDYNELNLTEEAKKWNQSTKNTGIIKENGITKKLQLWRAMLPIDGYISIRKEKKNELINLLTAVESFRNDPYPRRSRNCLLLAQPGWGKTFLAKSLAKMMNMNFLAFNITHMTSLDDLIDCFDTVSSTQNQQPERPILVFIDEINAEIANSPVYAYFLSPIWDGVFKRGAFTFQLKPCVWIFAGTEYPKQNDIKASDFLSRINGPKITLDVLNPNMKEQKTEQVYLGVSLLKNKFEDISSVSEGVLYFFHELKPKFGVRSLEYIIDKFKHVKYSTVDKLNLPEFKDISNQLKIKEKTFNNVIKQINKKKEMIKIEFTQEN